MDTALELLLGGNGNGGGNGGGAPPGRIYGVVPAIVVSIKDDKQKRHEMGMIQVRFPWLQAEDDPQSILPWARVCRPGTPSASGIISFPRSATRCLQPSL